MGDDHQHDHRRDDDHGRPDEHPGGGVPAPRGGDEGTALPAFDLPAWGTGGAPVLEPGRPPAQPTEDRPRTRHPLLVTVDALPGMRRVIGLLATEGSAPIEEEPGVAIGVARRAALDRLAEEAADVGADGVVGVRFSVALGAERAAVLVSGTAVAAG